MFAIDKTWLKGNIGKKSGLNIVNFPCRIWL